MNNPSAALSNVVPVSRFTDNGDGTITVARTGLIWSKADVTAKSVTHKKAEAACKKLDLAGHNDWRLPTVEELFLLADRARRIRRLRTAARRRREDHCHPSRLARDPGLGRELCRPPAPCEQPSPAGSPTAAFPLARHSDREAAVPSSAGRPPHRDQASMSHKDAPPLTPDQECMEAWYQARLTAQGATCGWGRDKHGNYLAMYARDAWAAWQAAKASE